MVKLSKSKVSYILSAVVVVAVLIYFYPELQKISQNGADKVIVPENYPTGTKVFIYNSLPPNFPSEIILENKELTYSGTVTAPKTPNKTTVSYISDSKITDLVKMYENVFKTNNWSIASKSVTNKLAIFQISQETQKITFTLVPIKDKGVMVTFQYQR